ncbi:MAG: DPP IV N-terminal domain-containing protein [Bacteroidota bacterium]
MSSRALIFISLFWTSLSASGQVLLTKHAKDDRYPRWSPDGQYLSFESNRDGNWNIYIMKQDGKDLLQVTKHAEQDRFATWHPSGQEILFCSDRTGKFELYRYNIETRQLGSVALDTITSDVIFPDYSPDGQQIAFTAHANLFLTTVDGTPTSQLTDDSTRSLYPVWSPDQGTLAFFSRRDTKGQTDDIYLYQLQESKLTRLTQWPTHNFAPSWSPNGRSLICSTSLEGGRPELYTIDVQSGELRRVTTNSYGDTEPDWHPDQNLIAYACQRAGNYDICLLPLEP